MKKILIKKGKHYNRFFFGLSFKKVIRKTFIFHKSCRYVLPKEDEGDINKLFGVYSITLKGLLYTLKSIVTAIKNKNLKLIKSLHQYNSVRVGWLYNNACDCIDIYAYVYENGTLSFKKICSTKIEKEYDYIIRISKSYSKLIVIEHSTKIIDSLMVPSNIFASIYLNLGAYFGGNNPAPHDIIIKKRGN